MGYALLLIIFGTSCGISSAHHIYQICSPAKRRHIFYDKEQRDVVYKYQLVPSLLNLLIIEKIRKQCLYFCTHLRVSNVSSGNAVASRVLKNKSYSHLTLNTFTPGLSTWEHNPFKIPVYYSTTSVAHPLLSLLLLLSVYPAASVLSSLSITRQLSIFSCCPFTRQLSSSLCCPSTRQPFISLCCPLPGSHLPSTLAVRNLAATFPCCPSTRQPFISLCCHPAAIFLLLLLSVIRQPPSFHSCCPSTRQPFIPLCCPSIRQPSFFTLLSVTRQPSFHTPHPCITQEPLLL